MSIKQKLTDFKVRLQKERKVQVITAVLVCAAAFLILSPSGAKRAVAPAKPTKAAKAGVAIGGGKEVYTELIEAFKTNLDEISKKTDDNTKKIVEMDSRFEENNERIAEILKKVLERVAESPTKQAAVSTNNAPGSAPVDVNDAMTNTSMPIENDSLAPFGTLEGNVVPPQAPPMQKVAFIGAGDSVRIKLLAGVNAPTDGTPYPVVFKLIGDIQGPDGSALPVGEARLIAAAQGSLTDQRALFRLTTLNIRMPNGRRKVVDVDGWVVGEDGIRGMEGILIDPIGKAIGAEFMVGALKGVGEGVSASNTTTSLTSNGTPITTLTGDIASFAAGKALSGGASQWESIVADRVKLLVPHVQVFSGREATAVFAKSIAIRDLYEALDENEDTLSTVD